MSDTIETRWERHNDAGCRYFSQGDYPQAEEAFVAALREATALGVDNPRLASSLNNLGQLKYKQRDFAQAETLFRRALGIRERALGSDHPGVVQIVNNLAALCYARGEVTSAEELFRRALSASEARLGSDHPDLAVPLNNLARLHFRRGDHGAAAPLLLRLLAIKQAVLGDSHPELAAILTTLARVRSGEGQHDAAEDLTRRALAIRERSLRADDPAIAATLEALADIAALRGNAGEELAALERALAVRSAGAADPADDSVAALRSRVERCRRAGSGNAMPPAAALTAADAQGHAPAVGLAAGGAGISRFAPAASAPGMHGPNSMAEPATSRPARSQESPAPVAMWVSTEPASGPSASELAVASMPAAREHLAPESHGSWLEAIERVADSQHEPGAAHTHATPATHAASTAGPVALAATPAATVDHKPYEPVEWRRRSRGRTPILLAAVALLAVVVGAWWAYGRWSAERSATGVADAPAEFTEAPTPVLGAATPARPAGDISSESASDPARARAVTPEPEPARAAAGAVQATSRSGSRPGARAAVDAPAVEPTLEAPRALPRVNLERVTRTIEAGRKRLDSLNRVDPATPFQDP